MAPLLRALGLGAALLLWPGPERVAAQTYSLLDRPANETHQQTVARINGGTVRIISGGIGGTYIRIATDLASVLDDSDRLRILPVMGKGSIQNIIDILYLRGIDVGIVQSDVLTFIKNKGAFGNVENRIHYVTKLYNEEFHLVASDKIRDVKELAGKKVNFGLVGSGTHMTATTVFGALGIKAEPVSHDQALALEKIRSGEIAATVYVTGKPARAVANLKAADGLRLLSVPYSKPLQQTYLPATVTAKDYPDLLADGERVNTIAVGAVMAVFNWRPNTVRYTRLVRFVNAFFSKIGEFQKPPRHKKWQEVNLAAEIPGWTRFAPAATWLTANKYRETAALKQNFARFVEAGGGSTGKLPLSRAQKEALFQEFVRWKQTRQ